MVIWWLSPTKGNTVGYIASKTLEDVALGSEPHFEVPTWERRQLKLKHQNRPKVIIGSAWKINELPTPDNGVTPVYTARCLSQLGGRPNKLELDPRLMVAAPALVRIPWGFLGYCTLVIVIGSVLFNTM